MLIKCAPRVFSKNIEFANISSMDITIDAQQLNNKLIYK